MAMAFNTLTYMFDRAAESMKRDDLAALQLARLRQTLDLAYNKVPHLRKKFEAANVVPEHLNSLADIVRFPFATKADLRDTYPFGMLAVPREKIARLHGSSGTTGRPTFVAYTRRDLDVWAGLCARFLVAGGLECGLYVGQGLPRLLFKTRLIESSPRRRDG